MRLAVLMKNIEKPWFAYLAATHTISIASFTSSLITVVAVTCKHDIAERCTQCAFIPPNTIMYTAAIC